MSPGPESWLGLRRGEGHLVVDEPEDSLLERREQRLGAGIPWREAQVHIDEGFGAVCTPPDSNNRVQVQSSDLSRLKSVELSALGTLAAVSWPRVPAGGSLGAISGRHGRKSAKEEGTEEGAHK